MGQVEFDVRMTKDRKMVILHDATVDRTTDGEGNIWDLTLAEVKQLRVIRTIPHPANPATVATVEELDRAGEVTDHRIPTLIELLDSLPRNLELNIHTYPGPEDKEHLVAGVVGEIQRRGLLQTAFVAGDFDVMHEAIRLEPNIRRCLLGATQNQTQYIAECVKLGCDICQPNWSIVSPKLCHQAHAAGIRVNPFWGDEVVEMERMLDAGVDGMLTNYPALLNEVLQQRGVKREIVRPSPSSAESSSRTCRRLGTTIAAVCPRPAAAIDTLPTTGLPSPPPGPIRQNEQSLMDRQRDRCLEELDCDSYTILPVRLPPDMINRALAFIDEFCADPANYLAPPKLYEKDDPRLYGGGFQMTNIVETDDVFREFLTYKPALQLCCESLHSQSCVLASSSPN